MSWNIIQFVHTMKFYSYDHDNVSFIEKINYFLKLKLFQKKSVEIFEEAKCVSWNIIQFVHTMTFYSYDHDNVSFIEKINNFHFSCHRFYQLLILFNYKILSNIEKALTVMLLAIGVKAQTKT